MNGVFGWCAYDNNDVVPDTFIKLGLGIEFVEKLKSKN